MGIGLDTPRFSANAQSLIYQYLSSVGDGTGTSNWIGDHTPEKAKYVCPAGKLAFIHRMLIEIADVGVIGVLGYGALAALDPGWLMKVYDSDDTALVDLTGGHAIEGNGELAALCYDATLNDYGAGNAGYVNARYSFDRAGHPLILKAGQYLSIDFNHDFTGLVQHRFMVQGELLSVFNKGT